MVISPNEIQKAYQGRVLEIKEQANILEKKIDEFLLRKATPGTKVHYPLATSEPKEVIAEVTTRYKQAGWEVERYFGVQQDASNDLVFKYGEVPQRRAIRERAKIAMARDFGW